MGRIIRVECLLYVVFFWSPTGLSTGPSCVIQRPKAKSANGPQPSKFEIRNWKVTGKTELELIAFVSGKHSSRRSKLFKINRVLQMSRYSSP